MVKDAKCSKVVCLIAGLLIVCLSLSSCESLRKKFTRHPRHPQAEDQSIVPVLEPVEYPAPQLSPEHNYREHYDLIKAWYHDLWANLQDKTATNKHSQYVIREVRKHIEEMQKLVDAQTQDNLLRLDSFLEYYNKSLDQPVPMRNVSRIESDLRAFDRLLRDYLRADRIKGHFIKALPAQ